MAGRTVALLIAGNHGDEDEGQIALTKLARHVMPGDVGASLSCQL